MTLFNGLASQSVAGFGYRVEELPRRKSAFHLEIQVG